MLADRTQLPFAPVMRLDRRNVPAIHAGLASDRPTPIVRRLASPVRSGQRRSGPPRGGGLDAGIHGNECCQFWFQSFQNWQSEFLAVAAIVGLSVYLRQQGSPESKPVHAPNHP